MTADPIAFAFAAKLSLAMRENVAYCEEVMREASTPYFLAISMILS
jgi:hypothetical protein